MPLPALLPLALAAAGGTALGSLFGKSGEQPGRVEKVQRFNQQQQGALNNLLSDSLRGINNLQQKPFDFAPIEAQARQGFNQQTVPSIAERFTSMGSGGALSSPAFASQLGQAGSGLETQLAALKSQVGLQP